MPDLALISAILGSIKAATDIVKALREADLSLEKAELKLRLADIMNALADARVAISSVQEELLAKDRRVKELEETLETRKRMKYAAPFYWLEDDGKREGPFCQHCYDAQGKSIRLQGHENDYWECKACGNNYVGPGHRPGPSHAKIDFDPFRF